MRYREHVDEGVDRLLRLNPKPEALRRIELGVNHEEQHQELLLTDILNAFFSNPLRPAYRTRNQAPEMGAPGLDFETWEPTKNGRASGSSECRAISFVEFAGGLLDTGYGGHEFCYDNELPRHRVWLEPFALADRLTTCAEFAAFIADGGYRRPELWLSAGWDAVERNGWQAPLYWSLVDGRWSIFTLRGELSLAALENLPVSQVSFYEADAYARWAGGRLATEYEWEAAAVGSQITGNLLDSGRLLPEPATDIIQDQGPAQQQYGDCWEWTASAYLGYPGYKPLAGALGEYNGKFMSGQMVLRGGACITPPGHVRTTYRNFFPPSARWAFAGLRLAADA